MTHMEKSGTFARGIHSVPFFHRDLNFCGLASDFTFS